jgi:hypothetical protein
MNMNKRGTRVCTQKDRFNLVSCKRSQFYLIAAIIIIVIIFGIYGVKNYVKEDTKQTNVYDLKKEFGLESGKVVDYTLYNNKQTDEWIVDWARTYFADRGQNVDDFILVYGNENSLTMLNLTKVTTGSVSTSGGSLPIYEKKIERTNIVSDNGKISFILGNVTYNYDVNQDNNLILVIREGDYVA